MKQIVLAFISGLVLSTSVIMATEKNPDSTFNPFEEIRKMQMEMENIFERFHKKMMEEDMFSKFTFSFPSSPAMDLIDAGNSYILKADMPGTEKRNINITIEDRVLKIQAETSKDKQEKGEGYLKQERFTSSYMRTISLPKDANTKEFESEYDDGVLKITIPKSK